MRMKYESVKCDHRFRVLNLYGHISHPKNTGWIYCALIGCVS